MKSSNKARLLCLVVLSSVALGAYCLAGIVEWGRYRFTIAPLRSEDLAVRETAVKSLRGGGPETVQVLAKALADADVRVRIGAARALGEFDQKDLGGADPTQELRATMTDRDPRVRDAAANALKKIH